MVGWVRSEGLNFTPGSSHEYSNTDNIVLGLIAEAATGESYRTLLQQIVFGPASCAKQRSRPLSRCRRRSCTGTWSRRTASQRT